MDMDISLEAVCSDLHNFLETKKDARNEFINGLIKLFPREKNDIAPYRKGDVGPETLAKWVFAHPTSIPLLTKCLEKNGKGILERMKTKAKDYGTSASKINAVAGKFFKVWGTDYENVDEGTTLERISKLEDTTKLLLLHALAQDQKLAVQNVHIDKQGNKIQELHTKIESLEQEIHRKNEQIEALIEENEKLKEALAIQVEKHTADQQALVRKIEELEKEKKVLEESRDDLREKVEREKAKNRRLMEDNNALMKKIDDMEEKDRCSDEIDHMIVEKPK